LVEVIGFVLPALGEQIPGVEFVARLHEPEFVLEGGVGESRALAFEEGVLAERSTVVAIAEIPHPAHVLVPLVVIEAEQRQRLVFRQIPVEAQLGVVVILGAILRHLAFDHVAVRIIAGRKFVVRQFLLIEPVGVEVEVYLRGPVVEVQRRGILRIARVARFAGRQIGPAFGDLPEPEGKAGVAAEAGFLLLLENDVHDPGHAGRIVFGGGVVDDLDPLDLRNGDVFESLLIAEAGESGLLAVDEDGDFVAAAEIHPALLIDRHARELFHGVEHGPVGAGEHVGGGEALAVQLRRDGGALSGDGDGLHHHARFPEREVAEIEGLVQVADDELPFESIEAGAGNAQFVGAILEVGDDEAAIAAAGGLGHAVAAAIDGDAGEGHRSLRRVGDAAGDGALRIRAKSGDNEEAESEEFSHG
jgi:hypothetical protein